MSSQRDTFLAELLEIAKKDEKVILLSADMGAPTLDLWREQLPKQVFQTGIAEQSTITFGAGLAARGYKVYVYTMGSWAARCFEQLRYCGGMGNLPITFLANGVGLGYVPSGPGHCSTEDIAYMRSLVGVEIYSPANCNNVKSLVNLTYENPKFRYIRLERSYAKELDSLNNDFPDYGMRFVGNEQKGCVMGNISILSSGYMLSRALKLKELAAERRLGFINVIDLFRVKPIDRTIFAKFVSYDHLITLEEQTLSGGFGSAVCEVVCDLGNKNRILRLGLPEKYIFENGTREEVLDSNGLSVENIYNEIKKFIGGNL